MRTPCEITGATDGGHRSRGNEDRCQQQCCGATGGQDPTSKMVHGITSLCRVGPRTVEILTGHRGRIHQFSSYPNVHFDQGAYQSGRREGSASQAAAEQKDREGLVELARRDSSRRRDVTPTSLCVAILPFEAARLCQALGRREAWFGPGLGPVRSGEDSFGPVARGVEGLFFAKRR